MFANNMAVGVILKGLLPEMAIQIHLITVRNLGVADESLGTPFLL